MKAELRPRSLSPAQEIFKNQFVRLYSVSAEFDGFTREYFVADKGQRVGTILWRGDEILLVRQYRLLIDGMSWELPGGGIKVGETAAQAAIRECWEETGVMCRSVHPLFEYQQGIDVTLSPAFLFESQDFQQDSKLIENQETDERRWVPYEQCVRQVLAGEIKDSLTIIALLFRDAISHRAAPIQRSVT